MRVIEKDKLFKYIPKPKNDIEADYYCEIADTITDLPEYIIDEDVQPDNYVNAIYTELAELFGSPCNFSPMDEYMLENGNCEDICCGDDMTDALCWKRYFETKLNQ